MNVNDALALVEAAHAAHNDRDFDLLLAQYVPEPTYWCNVGGPDGGPITIVGRRAFKESMLAFAEQAESQSEILAFEFRGGVARVSAQHVTRHLATGHSHQSNYRQIYYFTGGKISRLEEYLDAAQLMAFLKLIGATRPDGQGY